MARRVLGRGLIVVMMLLAVGMTVSMLQAKRSSLSADVSLPQPAIAKASGGPDDGGYTYWDNAVAGCMYNFIDLTTTGGNPVALGDEVESGTIGLVQSFRLYGVNYSRMYMGANGYLTTGPQQSGADPSNDCPLPSFLSSGSDGARIYPLHDDLVTPTGYQQYFPSCPRSSDVFGTSPDPCTIFQWDNAYHYNTTGAAVFDFEAILYHANGEVVFQFAPGNPEQGGSSTTGIQNEEASIGLTYACNSPGSLPDYRAVCFFAPLFSDVFESGDTSAWSGTTP